MTKYNVETDRLSLRLIQKDDAEILWPYVSNPEISKDMAWSAHKTKPETEEFIENTLKAMEAGKTLTWCIFMAEKFCGIFSLISILYKHRSLTYNRAELAYWLSPEFQGKGIMTEAGHKIIEFAFKDLGLHKLLVGHHVVNKNSENLILRLGFKFLYHEDEVFMKDGKWIDCKFYELNSKDFLKK